MSAKAKLSQRQSLARFHMLLKLFAAVGFAAGLMIAFDSLGFKRDSLLLAPIGLIALLGVLNLALSAILLQLTARTIGQRIGFLAGFAVSAMGSIAELLPLPGGAMVRGVALMRAGAPLYESSAAVTVGALLTLSLAISAAGIPLIMAVPVIGYLVFAVGVTFTTASAVWIVRRASIALMTAMIAGRIGSIVLSTARVAAAFSVVGIVVSPADAAIFVASATLGASVSIIPAGLGVSEGIAAALAPLIHIHPGAAFVAVALNRFVGIAISGVVALAFALTRSPTSTELI